jgi:hypothetical protein
MRGGEKKPRFFEIRTSQASISPLLRSLATHAALQEAKPSDQRMISKQLHPSFEEGWPRRTTIVVLPKSAARPGEVGRNPPSVEGRGPAAARNASFVVI